MFMEYWRRVDLLMRKAFWFKMTKGQLAKINKHQMLAKKMERDEKRLKGLGRHPKAVRENY